MGQQHAIHKFVLGTKDFDDKQSEFMYDKGWYSITDIVGEEKISSTSQEMPRRHILSGISISAGKRNASHLRRGRGSVKNAMRKERTKQRAPQDIGGHYGHFQHRQQIFQSIKQTGRYGYFELLLDHIMHTCFTIGAASTALYDTSRRVIHRDEGYVWRGYWHAFKVNFKQATKAWLVQLIILIVLLGDIYITWSGLKTGNQWGTFSIVFIIMALIAAAWAIYTSAYISRFEQVTKITLKNTILILIANLPWTLLVIVILVVSLILAWIIIPLIFILPVGAALTYEFIFERIFRKLMNEEDRLREEEKDKEYRD